MVGGARFERCVGLNYERVSESGLGAKSLRCSVLKAQGEWMFVFEERPRRRIILTSRLLHLDRAIVMLPSFLSSMGCGLSSQRS